MYIGSNDPFDDGSEACDRGAWRATSRGGFWSFEDPRPRDVHIADIAAGLSRICRYGGQIREEVDFYSVAEHSTVMMMEFWQRGIVKTADDALMVLLHDGSEAYVGDMITPQKKITPEHKVIENRSQAAVNTAFGIDSEYVTITYDQLKAQDSAILLTERDILIPEPASTRTKEELWGDDPSLTALPVIIRGQEPREARENFLKTMIFSLERLPILNPELQEAAPKICEDCREALAKLNRVRERRAEREMRMEAGYEPA